MSKQDSNFWDRVQLIMLFVVFLAPIVGAYFYRPSGLMNYGDLYQPPVRLTEVRFSNGEANVELHSLQRSWVFLVTAKSNCGAACEQNLLKVRQLRSMQNQHAKRIRSVFVSSQISQQRLQLLEEKFAPVEFYRTDFNDYSEWVNQLKVDGAPVEAQRDRLYVIDPNGYLVISYASTAEPKLIHRDIKRLLKAG